MELLTISLALAVLLFTKTCIRQESKTLWDRPQQLILHNYKAQLVSTKDNKHIRSNQEQTLSNDESVFKIIKKNNKRD